MYNRQVLWHVLLNKNVLLIIPPTHSGGYGQGLWALPWLWICHI